MSAGATAAVPREAREGRQRAPLGRVIGADILLTIALSLSMLVALTLGSTHLSLSDVARALLHPGMSTLQTTIVWQIRLPRIVLDCLVGASLAVAGLAFQGLLRNDLAEPYTTGVSAGAAVGAGAVIVFGGAALLGGLMLPAAAFAGAAGVLALVYSSARRGGVVDVRSMLLLGVVATAFLWAVQMLLLRLAGKSTDEILGWLMGSLAAASWADCAILAPPALVGLALLAPQAYAMNLFAMGEVSAQQLGLDVERFKRTVILAGSLLAGATVAVAGIVAFVGLVAPHIARRLVRTPDHRAVLPATLFTGALMLLWSDTLARLALGGDRIPVGVVTAFCGGPFFWYLLRRRGRTGSLG